MQRFVSMKSALASASGSDSVCQYSVASHHNGSVPTFFVMQLRVQRQADLRGADMLQLMLIVLNATKLANDFTQHIVLARTYRWQVTGDQVVY